MSQTYCTPFTVPVHVKITFLPQQLRFGT